MLIFLAVSIFLVSSASALAVGVSGDLSLYPGQTFDIAYDVMNTIGGQSLVVDGQFLEGSEIVSFAAGSRFNVPAGSVVPVPVRYRIPADAVIGTVYDVRVMFKTVSGGEGTGSVSFVEDAAASLKVRVVEPSAASAVSSESLASTERTSLFSSAWFWVLAIIIIAIVLWLVFRKKRSE